MSITTYGMEYAVSIGVVLIFLLLHILTSKKLREAYYEKMNAEEFEAEAANYIRTLKLPEKSGGIILTPKLKNTVRSSVIRLKVSRIMQKLARNFQIYDGKKGRADLRSEFLGLYKGNKKTVKELSKTDYAILTSLPSSDGEARIVKLARFVLAHSDYIFSADRVKFMIDEQNAYRTLTFNEICSLKTAFKYVLFEELAFEHKNITVLLKIDNKIKKCKRKIAVNNGEEANELAALENKISDGMIKDASAFYGEECVYEEGGKYFGINELYCRQCDALETVRCRYNNVIYSADALNAFEYESFYKPAERFMKYPNFANANENERKNFFALMGRLSDFENIDEDMYALRLAGFTDGGKFSRAEAYRFPLGAGVVPFIRYKNNILTLARALIFDGVMKDRFGKNKSFSKHIKEKFIKVLNKSA